MMHQRNPKVRIVFVPVGLSQPEDIDVVEGGGQRLDGPVQAIRFSGKPRDRHAMLSERLE